MTEWWHCKKTFLAPASLLAGVCLLAIFSLPAKSRSTVPQTQSRYWRNFFPAALDTDGLDARDSRNRPLRSPSQKAVLRGLFIASVVEAIADKNLPAAAAARKFLEKTLTPFKEQVANTMKRFFGGIEIAMIFNFKRFAQTMGRELSRLVSTLSLFCLFTALFLPAATYRSPLKLPLRC